MATAIHEKLRKTIWLQMDAKRLVWKLLFMAHILFLLISYICSFGAAGGDVGENNRGRQGQGRLESKCFI